MTAIKCDLCKSYEDGTGYYLGIANIEYRVCNKCIQEFKKTRDKLFASGDKK